MIAGDSEEIKRLQSLLSANPSNEEFTSAKDEMDALLGPELTLDELRRQHAGRNDFALEDWQITYRADTRQMTLTRMGDAGIDSAMHYRPIFF